MWNLLPQSTKKQDHPGTLGTIGSTFAADSPAATHLAQLGIASPDFAGDADFQEVVVKDTPSGGLNHLGESAQGGR